ncbi:hypothetical protein M0R45_014880 [Rubus argutus]|uniref:Secreted protein n=1 Tax=Rubus argutus TaxID=59490 RepID=A0AAW1XNH6_RUBAR
MGHLSASFCVLFWQIIMFVCVVLEGVNGSQANGWLNAHATFYGVNQDPALLEVLVVMKISCLRVRS